MSLIARVASIFLLIYTVMMGAHFRGILLPQVRLLTLFVLAATVIVWLVHRRRARWRWHRTPLDPALPLWLLAFALSLLLNMDASRRVLLGLWYMGVYIGLWYLLQDLFRNWSQARRTLVDALLLIGLLTFALSVIEWRVAFQSTGYTLLNYRFSGLLGNPNLLATFLTVLIVIALGRLAAVKSRALRMGLGVYMLTGALLLVLTGSRGAWIGALAALATWALLTLRSQIHTWKDGWTWWRGLPAAKRAIAASLIVVVVLVGAAAAVSIAGTFTEGQRGLSSRPVLFNVAAQMFVEKPLSGQGLFTYGRHLPRFVSLPPLPFHSHAHNIGIQIAGELGATGVIAALFTLVLMIRAARLCGQQTTGPIHAEWRAAAAASVGLGVIHLTDVTAMLPVITILGIITLGLTVTPLTAPAVIPGRKWFPRGVGLASLWTIVFVAGLWDSQLYLRYSDILSTSFADQQYAEAAARLQPLSDADPGLVIYPAQQAFLWGLSAFTGNLDASQQAIASYQRAIALEPFYAPYYANLGALYWESGDQQQGLQMMKQAAALAPQSWQIQYNLGFHAEALGAFDVARAAYAQTLIADPDADLYPEWGQTTLQAEYSNDFEKRSTAAQVMLLMESGEINEAVRLWDAKLAVTGETGDLVPGVLLALAQNDRDKAQALYTRAARAPKRWESEMWLLLADARLARFDGDNTRAAQSVERAHAARSYDPLKYDYIAGPDMAYYQYFHFIVPRQFLPQVFYPVDRVILLYLLDKS